MAKKETSKTKVKTGLKEYPLKKATKIGDVIRPIGYKILLDSRGYDFFKHKNIV